MEHQIKALVEAIGNAELKKLAKAHIKSLTLRDGHLTIYIDNQAPLKAMSDKEMEEPLKKALEKIYDPNITYELKKFKPEKKDQKERGPTYITW